MNSKRFRIERNLSLEDAMQGAKPLETSWAATRKEASAEMERLAAGGMYYAAIYSGQDGECLDETECPMAQASED